MAYLNQTRTAVDDGIPARFSTLMAATAERVAKYRLYRRTRAELGQLSNRELADLGLHRSQINSIAHQAAYGA